MVSILIPMNSSRNESSMQWEHPELTATYQAIQNRYRNIKFASYRIALKLRSVQKKIQSTYVHIFNYNQIRRIYVYITYVCNYVLTLSRKQQ